MGCSSQFPTPICLRFTSFLIGEIVVATSQKFKTNWQSSSPMASNQCFYGRPPQILSLMKSTWILHVIALDIRYLLPPIVQNMQRWKGPLWCDTTAVRRAFLPIGQVIFCFLVYKLCTSIFHGFKKVQLLLNNVFNMPSKFQKEVSYSFLVQNPFKHMLLILIIKVVGKIMQEIAKTINNNNAFSPLSIYVILNGY